MNRTEHLLSILAEECAEVAQRASKAARFGLTEVQPGQPLTNAERILEEMFDVFAMFEMLTEEECLPDICDGDDARAAMDAKKAKVEKFLAYSRECGTLTP